MSQLFGHELFLLLLVESPGVRIVFCSGKNCYDVLLAELLPVQQVRCLTMSLRD